MNFPGPWPCLFLNSLHVILVNKQTQLFGNPFKNCSRNAFISSLDSHNTKVGSLKGYGVIHGFGGDHHSFNSLDHSWKYSFSHFAVIDIWFHWHSSFERNGNIVNCLNSEYCSESFIVLSTSTNLREFQSKNKPAKEFQKVVLIKDEKVEQPVQGQEWPDCLHKQPAQEGRGGE